MSAVDGTRPLKELNSESGSTKSVSIKIHNLREPFNPERRVPMTYRKHDLVPSATRCPTIPTHTANSLVVIALHSAWSSVVQPSFVVEGNFCYLSVLVIGFSNVVSAEVTGGPWRWSGNGGKNHCGEGGGWCASVGGDGEGGGLVAVMRMKVMGCSWKMGVVAWSSVVAIENTGSDVVGMENEESDGDGPVNGEVIRGRRWRGDDDGEEAAAVVVYGGGDSSAMGGEAVEVRVVVRRVVAWRWRVGGGDEGDATVGMVAGGDGDGGSGGWCVAAVVMWVVMVAAGGGG
ncbi:hypothetical protein Tco_0974025 [Tanacetum coccineum]|uniref:Uncharacterized protein n=1 Tax=Tanacetum coccineum TaxID=301880 RepID=A0ABQ5EAE4_9ASTR